MIVLWTGKWWIWPLRGIAAIIFGMLALLMPGIRLEVLISFLGAFLLVDGASDIVASISHYKDAKYWWLVLLERIVSILIGVTILIWLQITALALLFPVVFWVIVNSIFRILAAIQLHRHIKGEWLLAFSGIFSLIFGILLLIWPGRGLLFLIWMLGFYAVIFGILFIFLAIKVRKLEEEA